MKDLIKNLNRPSTKVKEVAKIIVNESIDKGYFLSCYKLEQLLILMKGIYLERFGETLYPEDIFTTKRGLYIPSVERSGFFCVEDILENSDKLPVFIAVLQKEEEVIKYVLDNYGMLDSFDIRDCYAMSRLTIKYEDEESTKISDSELEKFFIKYGYSNLDEKKYEWEKSNAPSKVVTKPKHLIKKYN